MADDKLLAQFLEWAAKLSDEEVLQALMFLDQEYRMRLQRKDQMATLGLSAGDWIEMTKPGKKLPAGARGHIVKIRRGRLDVHFPQHGPWTIPASLARKVDGPPPAATK